MAVARAKRGLCVAMAGRGAGARVAPPPPADFVPGYYSLESLEDQE
jgi:hypothetical protein